LWFKGEPGQKKLMRSYLKNKPDVVVHIYELSHAGERIMAQSQFRQKA
jgi:hypothetical protein